MRSVEGIQSLYGQEVDQPLVCPPLLTQAARVVRSPIRWAGSKRKLLPQLLALAPREFRRYVEPFCGSLCMLIALKPDLSIVGDLNAELVNFYRMIALHPKLVASITHGWPADASTYYQLRAIDPEQLTAVQRAARFLYLNRFCFNGVYRTNRAGVFNVARGRHMGSVPPVDELCAFGDLMRQTEVRACDFETLLADVQGGDFVYLDPPYARCGVRDRGEYGPGAFKVADLPRLKDALEEATRRGAKVLLSYADLPEIRDLFRDWQLTRLDVARNVAGFVGARASVSELVLRNYR